MKLAATILLSTFVCWLVQMLLLALLFATWLTHFVLQVFVALGWPLPESSLQAFLSQVLNVFIFPARVFLRSDWRGNDGFTMALLFVADSIVWGIILGTLLYLARRRSNRAG